MVETLTISDPEAARAFSGKTPRAILFALMQDPASPQTLSLRLGLSLSLLHYHLAKLRRLGLVEIERHEPRAGRAIAVYRPTALTFVVPTHLTHAAPSASLKAELEGALQRDKARNPAAAVVFELGQDGRPTMRRIRSPDSVGGSTEWWGQLTLTPAQAEQLSREARELLDRHVAAPSAGGRAFLFHFALAPT